VTDGREPLGWQCFRQVTDGDVVGRSDRSLSADGSVQSYYHSWEWSREVDGVTLRELEMEEPFGAQDLAGQLLVFVDVPRGLRRRTVGIELGLGEERSELGRQVGTQAPHQPQYAVSVTIENLLSLAAAGHTPAVVGHDRAGQVLFRLPIDIEAIRRGREAMRQAMEATSEMARNFATACQRDKRSQDAIIIT
jgi:hypothetical protein